MVALVHEVPLQYGLTKAHPGRRTPYTASEHLSNILSQHNRVSAPVFGFLSSGEFQELVAAKPYMTESEQKAIIEAKGVKNLTYRVAEAIGRVNAERGLDISIN